MINKRNSNCPVTQILSRDIVCLAVAILMVVCTDKATSQDLASVEYTARDYPDDFNINRYSSTDYAIYPECVAPTGTVRYAGGDHDVVRFSEAPNIEFYYRLRVGYDDNISNAQMMDVKNDLPVKIPHGALGAPHVVEVQRVCVIEAEPFVYRSEWINVPEVQLARSPGDSICAQFNGAGVEILGDGSFKVGSPVSIKGPVMAVSFSITVTSCRGNVQVITVSSLPDTIPENLFGQYDICLIQIKMSYQGQGQIWHQCSTFTVYENEEPPGTVSPCVEDPDTVVIQQSQQLFSLQGHDDFSVAGFPITIDSLIDDLSGFGRLTLPFNQKTILVHFNDVQINQQRQAYSLTDGSTITAVSDTFTYPSNNLAGLGEKCLPSEEVPGFDENGIHSETDTIWDPYGFDVNGEYVLQPPYPGYKEGDPFDPNFDPCGFQANGIHFQTGTLYNSDGCSRDSLNAEGQKCDLNCIPYYWIPQEVSTLEGIQFWNAVKDSLPIDSILNVLSSSYTQQRDSKVLECAGIANQMRGIVNSEGLDSVDIFGENSEYINPGLSTEFTTKPSEMVEVPRDADIKALEKKHIDLYECDQEFAILKVISERISDLLIDDSELLAYLAVKIKAFNASQVTLYQTDHQAWMAKLVELIVSFLNEEAQEGIGYLKPIHQEEDFDQHSLLNQTPFQYFNSYQARFASLEELLDPVDVVGAIAAAGSEEVNILPLEITKFIQGETFKIVITSIAFSPQYLEVSAYAVLKLPLAAEQLVFSGSAKIANGGLLESASLQLQSSVTPIRINNVAALVLDSAATYVEWDCTGFKEMSIGGYIEFCENILLPLDENGEPITDPAPEDRVKAYFAVPITKFNGWLVDLTMDSFALADATNVRCYIEGIGLDMHDMESPAHFTFPVGYTSPHAIVSGGVSSPRPEWKGFYIDLVAVSFTGGLKDGGEPVTFQISNAVIDDRGFSGYARVDANILSLDDGDIGGWAASIDYIEMHVLYNKLFGGGFGGFINVPIFKSHCDSVDISEADCFEYSAQVFNDGDFLFSISPKNQMCVDIWSADVVIDSNSTIIIKKADSEFLIEACLSGGASFEGDLVSVDTLSFQNVKLRNQAPYFSPGQWDITNLFVGYKGFGITIDSAEVRSDSTKVHLSFVGGIQINSAFDLKAIGGCSIFGDLEIVDNRQRWVIDTIKLTGLGIDTEIGQTKIVGSLIFFENDSIYGNGFNANLFAKFAKTDFTVKASGIFGKVGGMQYFNVDALFQFSQGVPLFGPVEVSALGGGLSYHMRNADPLAMLPAEITNYSGDLLSEPPGYSLTGAVYEPDSMSSIGVKIILAGTIKSESICSYNALFEIRFGNGGSLDYVGLRGSIRMMSDYAQSGTSEYPDTTDNKNITPADLSSWSAPDSDAPICGYLSLSFEKIGQKHILQGKMALFFRAGDIENPIIYGEALAEIHIADKDNWYFNVGRLKHDTTGRVRLTIDVAVIRAQMEAYLNIGTDIPPLPPPPKAIRDLFPNVTSPDASLGWGTGFAFGAAIDVALNIDFSVASIDLLTIRLNAGFGFDLAMKKYNSAVCAATNAELGINGWYATGQAYLYLNGEVKLFGAKLLDVASGVLLQGGFPNPSWVQGRFRLKYKILFIPGNINVNVKFGQKCIPIGEEGSELPEVIFNVVPVHQSEEVDAMTSIHVDFNLPMDTSFTYEGTSGPVNYRTEVYFLELKTESGFSIPMQRVYNEDKMHLELIPEFVLPTGDSITFVIQVKVFKNNVLISGLEGVDRTVGFTTIKSASIPASNIAASYPVHGMTNFYREQYNKHEGYIILERNQYDLVQLAGVEDLAVVISTPSTRYIGTATYEDNIKTIVFPIPPSALEPDKVHQLEIVLAKSELLPSGQAVTTLSAADYEAMKKLSSLVFRVSNYETLEEKVGAIASTFSLVNPIDMDELYYECMAFPIGISEPFDVIEIQPVRALDDVFTIFQEAETLIDIRLDVGTIQESSDYVLQDLWMSSIIDDYREPLREFAQQLFGSSDAPTTWEELATSVGIGADCERFYNFLHPPIGNGAFDNQQGAAMMEEFPVEMSGEGDPVGADGSSMDPIDTTLASDQYIRIYTATHLGKYVTTARAYVNYLLWRAIEKCLAENDQGMDMRVLDVPNPCSSSLLPQKLRDILLYPPTLETPPEPVKFPIIFTYKLPGIDHQTSSEIIITYEEE